MRSLLLVFYERFICKTYDPDVIRTRSLLIWSQTRYRCATESTRSCHNQYRMHKEQRMCTRPWTTQRTV